MHIRNNSYFHLVGLNLHLIIKCPNLTFFLLLKFFKRNANVVPSFCLDRGDMSGKYRGCAILFLNDLGREDG